MIDLHLGDCLDIMRGLPDASVDAVITDPPYGANIAKWDTAAPHQNVLSECLRISRGAVVWFGGRLPSEVFNFGKYLPIPERIMIWHVTFSLNPVVENGIYLKWHPIYCWRLPRQDIINRDVLEYPVAKNNGYNHPAKKPEELMMQLVSAFGGNTVLDPFMGAGTTGVACVKLNRSFIGIEINPQYFGIAQRRIAEAQQQMVLL